MNRALLAAARFSVSNLVLVDSAVKGTARLVLAAVAAMILRRDSAADSRFTSASPANRSSGSRRKTAPIGGIWSLDVGSNHPSQIGGDSAPENATISRTTSTIPSNGAGIPRGVGSKSYQFQGLP